MGPRGDAIAQLDWCTGELLATLDQLNLTDNTLVIFTSDNGPVVDDGYRDDRNRNTELGLDASPQLYNLEDDLGEQHNLAAQHPDKTGELAARLESIRKLGRSRP